MKKIILITLMTVLLSLNLWGCSNTKETVDKAVQENIEMAKKLIVEQYEKNVDDAELNLSDENSNKLNGLWIMTGATWDDWAHALEYLIVYEDYYVWMVYMGGENGDERYSVFDYGMIETMTDSTIEYKVLYSIYNEVDQMLTDHYEFDGEMVKFTYPKNETDIVNQATFSRVYNIESVDIDKLFD